MGETIFHHPITMQLSGVHVTCGKVLQLLLAWRSIGDGERRNMEHGGGRGTVEKAGS